MNKLAILLISFACLSISCQNKEIDISLYPALQIAKETSLYSEEVDWATVSKEYVLLAESGEGRTTKYEYLLNALGDEHGTFRDASTFQILANYTQETSETRSFDSKFIYEVLNDTEARFSYRELEGKIGYLKVVGIGPQFPMEEDASLIQQAIATLKEEGVKKWIVDLRFNGGGNMNPMLAGLAALLGEGDIGGSTDQLGNALQSFHIQDGQFYDTGNLPVAIDNPITTPITDSLAVLLSKYTVSSGEIVAVAFKGREHTRFFGEKTRGMTTVTGYDQIDDSTLMLISKAYYRDRNQGIYKDGIAVDESITFEEFAAFADDEILQSSIYWLNQ